MLTKRARIALKNALARANGPIRLADAVAEANVHLTRRGGEALTLNDAEEYVAHKLAAAAAVSDGAWAVRASDGAVSFTRLPRSLRRILAPQ